MIGLPTKVAQKRKGRAKARREKAQVKRWAKVHEELTCQAINTLDFEQWAVECDCAVDKVDTFPGYKGYMTYYNEWMEICLQYTGKRYFDLHPDSMEDAVLRRIEERQARDWKSH